MTIRTKIAYVLASTTALVAVQAHAQTTPSGTSTVAPPAARDSFPDESRQDIIVTAQKRSERLQDVPITITAVTANQIEKAGIQSLGKLPQIVPALRFDNSSVYSQPSIRGVGSSVSGTATGSAVGIYVDGFYLPSPLTTDFDLLSVSSIQVLKGPQGTLFGRNTTAGAILVTTKAPSVKTEIMGKFSYARFNALDVQVYGTTGLSDRVAIDLAARYRRGDGFLHNLVTNSDRDGKYENVSVRAGLKIDLDDAGKNSILFRYAHTSTDDPTMAAQTVFRGESIGTVIPGTPVASRRGEISSTERNLFKSRSDAGYVTGRFDLGFADLTSYTMYRSEKAREGVDFDGTPIPAFYALFRATDKTFTQEVNLISKTGGPLNWVVGGYFYRERSQWPSFKVSVFGSPLLPLWNTSNTVTSYAAFADGTYNLAEHLYLTAGVRYSHEHDEAFYNLLLPDALTGQPVGFYPGKKSWDSVTPRAVIRYEFAPSSSVYGSFSKGFKAGFLNANGLTSTPIAPEKITAFEIGYKYSRGPTRFSISAFNYNYSNLQVATYNGALAIVTNAAKSKLYGGEFEFTTKLDDRFGISLGAAYTHSEYNRYAGAPFYSQVLDPANPAFGTFQSAPVDASGNIMQRAPRFSGNAAIDYTAGLAGGSINLNATFSYQSKVYFDPANQFEQNGYGLLNLRATWTDPTQRWSFSVFGTNVTDRTYARTVFPTPFAILQVYGEPASYGGSIAFHF